MEIKINATAEVSEEELDKKIYNFVSRNISDFIDVDDLAGDVQNKLDYYQLSSDVANELDYREIAEQASEYMDTHVDIDSEALRLLDSYSVHSRCNLGNAFYNAIHETIVHLLDNNNLFLEILSSRIDEYRFDQKVNERTKHVTDYYEAEIKRLQEKHIAEIQKMTEANANSYINNNNTNMSF
jgi:uncharacterized damage-inducible protein DinB